MKRKLVVLAIVAAFLLTGCGNAETEQIVVDTANAYTQMYLETWQDLLGKAERGTTYEFADIGSEFRYYKVKDGLITLQQIMEQTEEICTKEFAKEELYEKLLESSTPILFDDSGELYVLEAELPGPGIGEVQEVEIIEQEEDSIYAKLLGEDASSGETITFIEIEREDGVWKVDDLDMQIVKY